MKQVLIIDDDDALCALMKKCVEHEGLSGLTASGGAQGLRLAQAGSAGLCLVILDVMMPDLDGFQVLQQLRTFSNVPVLMLTAKSGEDSKVTGLRLGADDYLTKPFSINELMARVNSLVRRYTTLNPAAGAGAEILTLHGMTLDRGSRSAAVNGRPVELTGKEFDLLCFLASNKGRVFTKRQIYTQVWEDDYAFDDSNIMSFISKLRKKIEPDPEQPFYIQTVRGVGYRFNREA
ncbi:MAG: response regulator transcription factor [Eubacteriales bacterium]|nr:response regulator transcription factor [Eubacteriales bacterium]